MQKHDLYGKSVLKRATEDFRSDSIKTEINFGKGGIAKIDGVIGDTIAVEIESRVNKQIRGALMDLILHPYPLKLLVILPVHMNNPSTTINQCKFILGKFLSNNSYQIALLKGDGNNKKEIEDIIIIKSVLDKFPK